MTLKDVSQPGYVGMEYYKKTFVILHVKYSQCFNEQSRPAEYKVISRMIVLFIQRRKTEMEREKPKYRNLCRPAEHEVSGKMRKIILPCLLT